MARENDQALAERQVARGDRLFPINMAVADYDRTRPLIDGRITALFENLPVFDFWPFRYATSYELNPGCDPVPREDPRFDACWTPVGDFPEVDISFKSFATRVLTAFGAGLAPIL